MRIALAQMDTVWHDPAANLAKAEAMVSRAAREGCRVVAFPELFATGFTMEPERFAETVPGPLTSALSDLAKAHRLWIVAGGIEVPEPGREGAKPRNAMYALSPDGALAHTYRKIHPFTFGEEALHYDGGDTCATFELDGIPTLLVVCYDLRFPELFRPFAAGGAKLAFVIANWPTRRAMHWSTLLAARAIENQMVVCGVNRCGSEPRLNYPGLSVIHDATGEVLALGGDQEELVIADVDFAHVDEWRSRFPALRDRRPDVYSRLG